MSNLTGTVFQVNLLSDELMARSIRVGHTVVRGTDWPFGDERDGGEGGHGTVIGRHPFLNNFWRVHWNITQRTISHPMGPMQSRLNYDTFGNLDLNLVSERSFYHLKLVHSTYTPPQFLASPYILHSNLTPPQLYSGPNIIHSRYTPVQVEYVPYTPVQVEYLPTSIDGRDVVVTSQSSSETRNSTTSHSTVRSHNTENELNQVLNTFDLSMFEN